MIPRLLVSYDWELSDTHALAKYCQRFTKSGSGWRNDAVVFKLMCNRGYPLTGRVFAHWRSDFGIDESRLRACLVRAQVKDILDLDSYPVQRSWLHQIRRHPGLVYEVAIRLLNATVDRPTQVDDWK